MSTKLYYDSQEILINQPTPFVGREDSFIRYGDRWADKNTFTLKGQITGCTYSTLRAAQDQLINTFSKDFQKFEIKDNGNSIFSANYCMVERVDFPQSNYAYILDYTVSLNCYQENLFSGTYGVLDPVDEWAFEETNDYIVNLTHTVSARGFNTSSTAANALQNAKSFVSQRMGITGSVAPAFIAAKQGSLSFCLKDLRERVDRFNGTYAVTEVYKADSYYGTDGLLRYASTFDCDNLGGISKVSIQGEIEGCAHATDMSGLRARYNNLNLPLLASGVFTAAGPGGVLNGQPVSNGITEDPFNKRLSFSTVYDNNPDPLVYLDYGVGIEVSENEITSVNFQGTIKGRGDINTRWDAVQDYYSTLNPYSYALSAYTGFGGTYPLNTSAINQSTTFNKFNAEISISESWDNRDLPLTGFKNFSYTLHFTPSFQKVAFTPLAQLCGKQYYIVDLGYQTRCGFSVDGNGKICLPGSISNGISAARQLGNTSFSTYCPSTNAVLETKDIGSSEDSVSFKFAWSAKGAGLNSSIDYVSIGSLSLK